MKRTKALLTQFLIVQTLLLFPGSGAFAQPTESRKLFLVDDDSAFIDINGNVVISSSDPRLWEDIRRVYAPGENHDGLDTHSSALRFGEFSEGLATVGWARCPMCRNPLWINGFIDETGRLVIPPAGSNTRHGAFHEGLAQYHDRGVGFIDREGRVKIPAKYHEASDFSEGLALVRPLLSFQLQDTAKFGFINREGKLVIPYQFEWAGDFHNGVAAIRLSRGRYGFIDKTGKLALRSKDWLRVSEFSEELAAVEVKVRDDTFYRGYEEERWGYIDLSGSFVVAPNFYRAERFSEGLALVVPAAPGNGVGFVDVHGQMVIKPDYAEGRSFSEGLAAVAITNRDEKKVWGYINRAGEWVIDPQYAHVNSFSGGLAAVDCDEYGRSCKTYIDKQGRVVWQTRKSRSS